MKQYKAVFLDWDDTIGDWTNAEHKALQDIFETNPWPEWPRVLKTDYGHEEAIARFGHDPRVFRTTVKELILRKGKLWKIRTVEVHFENGRLVETEGTEKIIPCGLLLIAAGCGTGCSEISG